MRKTQGQDARARRKGAGWCWYTCCWAWACACALAPTLALALVLALSLPLANPLPPANPRRLRLRLRLLQLHLFGRRRVQLAQSVPGEDRAQQQRRGTRVRRARVRRRVRRVRRRARVHNLVLGHRPHGANVLVRGEQPADAAGAARAPVEHAAHAAGPAAGQPLLLRAVRRHARDRSGRPV
jgi:hypothetical protein